MLSKVITEEKDPEVLQMYLKHVVSLVAKQKKEIEILRVEKNKKDQQRLKLDDQLTAMRKRQFGKSTEKRSSARPKTKGKSCLLYTSPSPRDQRGSRMPSSA